jgi:hypothetical protein
LWKFSPRNALFRFQNIYGVLLFAARARRFHYRADRLGYFALSAYNLAHIGFVYAYRNYAVFRFVYANGFFIAHESVYEKSHEFSHTH